MRLRLGVIVFVLASVVVPAKASVECASYKVTAPVVGTKQGGACPVSSPFTHAFTEQNCSGIPPAGVTVCVSLTVHTP